MHPGPMNRGMEITAEVADGPRSVIVEQVTNGVSVRMAVLYLLLEDAHDVPDHRRPPLGWAGRRPAHRGQGHHQHGAAGSLSADGATVVDAEGLIALPGLVDLHTHLREPGREDADGPDRDRWALGPLTAVHAMANTNAVADTAGVVEQVWHLGKSAGLVDVFPVGAVAVGLGGQRLAELGAIGQLRRRSAGVLR